MFQSYIYNIAFIYLINFERRYIVILSKNIYTYINYCTHLISNKKFIHHLLFFFLLNRADSYSSSFAVNRSPLNASKNGEQSMLKRIRNAVMLRYVIQHSYSTIVTVRAAIFYDYLLRYPTDVLPDRSESTGGGGFLGQQLLQNFYFEINLYSKTNFRTILMSFMSIFLIDKTTFIVIELLFIMY